MTLSRILIVQHARARCQDTRRLHQTSVPVPSTRLFAPFLDPTQHACLTPPSAIQWVQNIPAICSLQGTEYPGLHCGLETSTPEQGLDVFQYHTMLFTPSKRTFQHVTKVLVQFFSTHNTPESHSSAPSRWARLLITWIFPSTPPTSRKWWVRLFCDTKTVREPQMLPWFYP